MATNKNAMARIRVLDELLSNPYRHYSMNDLLKEVNDRVVYGNGVVKRTIQNDMEFIKKEFGGTILCTPVDNVESDCYNQGSVKYCYRYEDPSFSIFKKTLSDDERYLLREALTLMGQFKGLPEFEGLERLRQGLKVRGDVRQIISMSKNLLDDPTLFGRLFTRISQREVVELVYHPFTKPGVEETLLVHPYLLKEYNRRWYLLGMPFYEDSEHKKPNGPGGCVYSYSLDRIDMERPVYDVSYVPYSGDLDEEFEDVIGVTRNGLVYKFIEFWVSDRSKEYLLTKPMVGSQTLYKSKRDAQMREKYPMLQGGNFFSIKCPENYELIRELSSFGKELVVLSPARIRDLVVERAREMVEIYSKM